MASCSHKHSVVTLEQKLEAVAMLKDGESQVTVRVNNHVHRALPRYKKEKERQKEKNSNKNKYIYIIIIIILILLP